MWEVLGKLSAADLKDIIELAIFGAVVVAACFAYFLGNRSRD